MKNTSPLTANLKATRRRKRSCALYSFVFEHVALTLLHSAGLSGGFIDREVETKGVSLRVHPNSVIDN